MLVRNLDGIRYHNCTPLTIPARNMITTQPTIRPEAQIPPPTLATDFDEWMAGWVFKLGGTRYIGKPLPANVELPGNAWKTFKQEPRQPSAPQSPVSLCCQFLQQVTPPKLEQSESSSSSNSTHSRTSSSSSIDSIYPKPPKKPDPLFVTEFFEVHRSPKGGYGAFATKDIEVGTVVMSEEPLFRATFSEVFYKYENLTTEQRVEYRSLHGWSGLGLPRLLAIFKTNRFEIPGGACGIFIKSSRFNHACHPHATCTYKWNEELGHMVTTSINPMKNGDEVTIQYTNNPSKLYDDYGFHCDCPACPDPKEAGKQHRMRQLPMSMW
ncbi:SET domain-containing protein [Acephala macrosclerotiorum]|nr:SET domain-containing protein [Acephala macrosclerotiorum]